LTNQQGRVGKSQGGIIFYTLLVQYAASISFAVSKSMRFIIVVILSVIVFTLPGKILAQERENVLLHPQKFYRKFFPKLRIKRDPPDTAYIKSYPNYLSVGIHMLSPAIKMDILPKGRSNTGTSEFRTNIPDIAGLSASYRFISAGFSILMKSGIRAHDDYARSSYRTATIKYTGSANSFQYKYLRFKGLTDVNPSNSFNRSGYVRRPDIVNKEFQFEWLHNFSWRKYSNTAPFTFTQRQVKSRAGFLLKAGIYYTQLTGDSALIGQRQQPFYNEDFTDVRVIRTLSLRLAPGVGGNVVFFRRYYLFLSAFPSYDLYFYKYLNHPEEKVRGKQTFVFVLDGKASLGYQSERFYAGLKYEAESRRASLHHISRHTMFTYVGLEVGYRFNTPRVVKKVYKDTMPPGM
jgi:hypothetical protein